MSYGEIPPHKAMPTMREVIVGKVMDSTKDKNTSGKSFSELTRAEREALAIQAVKNAIARMHSKGIATVEVDDDGKLYLHHPDGDRTPIINQESDDTTSRK